MTGVFNPLETQYLKDTMGNKKSPGVRCSARRERPKNVKWRIF
nr:MAG TPA: hypothetical protein [Caudoviricetes sp.]